MVSNILLWPVTFKKYHSRKQSYGVDLKMNHGPHWIASRAMTSNKRHSAAKLQNDVRRTDMY